jgi:Concanavalin A-like lectin/glucanases superfamily
MVTTYLKLFRASGDELDHSVVSDITFRLQNLESNFQSVQTVDNQDLVQIRSNLTRDYLEFFDSCFHVLAKKEQQDYYLQNEPDYNENTLLLDFGYRTALINDESGFGNNGMLVGRPKIKHYDVAEPAYSLHFNGTTNVVNCGTSTDFNFTNTTGFTFLIWFKPESQAGAKKVLFDRGAISAWQNGAYQLYRDTSDNIVFECQNGSAVRVSVSCNSISLKGLDKWYMAAIRYNGTTLSMIVYADDGTTVTTSAAQTGSFTLSANLTFGNTALGNLDEIMFYNLVLTDAEVLEAFNMDESLLGVKINGLILWLGFNDKYFSENFHTGFTRDLSNYHTGTITGATYDTNTAINLSKFKPRDFISDIRRGFKLENDKFQYIHIPEKNNTLKIKGQTGARLFDFELLLKDCTVMNNWNQRILEKFDHTETETKYGYSVQLAPTNHLLIAAYWNDVKKQVKSIAPLPLDLLTRLQVVIDIDDLILNSTDTACLKMGIDGFYVSTNQNDDNMQLPDFNNPTNNNTDFRVLKSHRERGYFQGNNMIFNLRQYKRELNALEVLSLATNHDTIYEIPVGRIAVMDLLPMIEESPFYRPFNEIIKVDRNTIDLFTANAFDLIPTVRFSDKIGIPVDPSKNIDSFVSKLGTVQPPGGTGNFSLDLDNDWVELPVLREIDDEFTLLFFVKFMGADEEWGTIICGLDGMDDGNAWMMKDTRIRYWGQFEDNDEEWDDYRTTIPDCTNTWISLGFTYEGDKHRRFRLYYNGKMVYEKHRSGNIQHGNQKGRIGQFDNGNRKLTNHSRIWHLYGWRSEFTPEQVMEFHLTGDESTGKNRFFQYDFIKNVKDSSDKKFHGNNKGGATYSTDVPNL